MKTGILVAFCVLALATLSSAARISMHQMAMIWKQQGGHDCQTAVAIGYATSMGNTKSRRRSPIMGGVDRGLWGINTISAPGVSTKCAFDSNCGAKAAISLSMNGADWSKFAAYVNGMHMAHMQPARQACGPSGFDIIADSFDAPTSSEIFSESYRRLRGKHLSMHQMAMLWKKQGGFDCQTAVAIGYATSMGNPKARTRSVMGGLDRGLWGLNSISASHVSTNCAFSADCSTKAAVHLSLSGTHWSSFPAYVNGFHMAYMQQAKRACT